MIGSSEEVRYCTVLQSCLTVKSRHTSLAHVVPGKPVVTGEAVDPDHRKSSSTKGRRESGLHRTQLQA